MVARNLIAVAVAAALMATSTRSQRFEEVSSVCNLGFFEPTGPYQLVPLGDDGVAVLSRSVLQHPTIATDTPHLLLLRNVIDDPMLQYLPVSLPFGLGTAIRRKPIKITDARLALPSPGPDLLYGTADDVMLVFDQLDEPATSIEVVVPLGGSGPGYDRALMPLAADCLAWFGAGPDGLWNSGDETLRYLGGLDAGAPWVATLATGPLRVDGHACALDGGAFAFKGAGPDGLQGTADDQIGSVVHDPASGQPVLTMTAVTRAVGDPLEIAAWPKHAGGSRVVFPDIGPDATLGTADDVLVMWDFAAAQPLSFMTVGTLNLWNNRGKHARIGVESDGRLLMQGTGLDGEPDTTDDALHWFDVQAQTVETIVPGVSLYDLPSRHWGQVTMLGGDAAVMRQYGGTGVMTSELVTRRLSDGTHVVTMSGSGDILHRVVPTAGDEAVLFFESGAVIRYGLLSTASPTTQTLTWPNPSPLNGAIALRPNLLVGTRWESTVIGGLIADHRFQIRRDRGTICYGGATANAYDYQLELDAPGAMPTIGGAPFFLQLLDAPPSAGAYLLLSTNRDSFHPAVDAELLIGLEGVLQPRPWGTYADGSTYYPVVPPTDPLLEGLVVHAQFVVFDASAPRQYELSNGLTLVF